METQLKKTTAGTKAESAQKEAPTEKRKPSKTWLAFKKAAENPGEYDREAVMGSIVEYKI